MYTILLNDSNELVVTEKERIMQRSKLVDTLRFLVTQDYKGLNMSDYTVMMEYLLPVSREYKSEILVKQDTMYKDKLDYRVPLDTCLTREAGDVEVQLTFIKVDLDTSGSSIQRVRKTSPTTLTIVPISAWSDIIADSALSAIDQRLIQVNAMVNAMEEMNQMLYETKADNITLNKAENYIQLTANGVPIGNKIVLGTGVTGEGIFVKCVVINSEGELIVTYSDDTTENIGKVSCDAVSGIYIPDVSEDGILTMTLSQELGEPNYSWDIDHSNNWNDISGIESETTYVWEAL